MPLDKDWASPQAPINVPAASAIVKSNIKVTAAVVTKPVAKPNKTKVDFSRDGFAENPEKPINKAANATKIQHNLIVQDLPKRGTMKKPVIP